MTSLPLPPPLRRRWFLFRSPADETLTVSIGFSFILVILRIVHTGRLTFAIMPWNLLLAYAPYVISTWLTRPGRRIHRAVTVAGLGAWLLLIPNSFYILTDLYHLADGHRNARVPEWYDLALILSFAVNGTLLGVLSTRQVERLVAPRAGWFGRWAVLLPIMWLNAFGVYIGRYLRYNSWDVFFKPADLVADIVRMLIHPVTYHYAWYMTCCYSILLSILYSLLTKPYDHY